MSALPTDPGTLSSFPMDREVMSEIFGCARCHKIPNPDDYFIIEETGDSICSNCGKSADPQESRQKGPPHLLKSLLMNSKWECKYVKRGCHESVLGSDWARHVDLCKYSRAFCCKFYGCKHEGSTSEIAVDHLIGEHKAVPLQGLKTILCIPFDELLQKRRMLAMISWNDGHYLYCSEICDNTIYMWMWSIQELDYDDGKRAVYKLNLEANGETRNDSNANAGVSFIGPCLPYKFTASDVISDEDRMSIPLGPFMKQYLTLNIEGNKVFTVETFIKNRPSDFGSSVQFQKKEM
ncbi:E3 ubiquitin-protein ligase Siah1 [Orchesella cincta]|uniref:E3 ubiquitin-protein ligase Siah1 n=1 Tax=Orchesella cincta TaxID=48709 RepID=A0A1D2MJY9_ORCCI|nr:E3 ubiquitin-protein ligase Siah1 [Orchesella cincta]